MRIIDMNVAIGARDTNGNVITAEHVYALMENYRLDHVVAYHTHAKFDHAAGNAQMASIAKKSSGKIGMCAVLDPALGADSLQGNGTLATRLDAIGAEAIRVFPSELRVTFSPFYFEEILDAAAALSMPIIIDEDLATSPVHRLFSYLPDMAAQYENVPFVILRYGVCNIRHILPLATKCANVYFTIEKMLDHMQIEEICERGAASKLLFGSGYPSLPLDGALGLAMYADVCDTDRAGILAKNWEAIRYEHS